MKTQGIHNKTLSLLHIIGLFFLALSAQLIFWPAAWHHVLRPPELHLILFVYFCLYSSFVFSVLIILSLSLLLGSVSSVSPAAFFIVFSGFYFLLLVGRGFFHWRRQQFLMATVFFVSFFFSFYLKIFSSQGLINSLSFDFLFSTLLNTSLTTALTFFIHPLLENYIKNKGAL